MKDTDYKELKFAFRNLLKDCVAWVDHYGSERYWPDGTVSNAMSVWNDHVIDSTNMPVEQLQYHGNALYDGMCGSIAEGLYADIWQTNRSYNTYFEQRIV